MVTSESLRSLQLSYQKTDCVYGENATPLMNVASQYSDTICVSVEDCPHHKDIYTHEQFVILGLLYEHSPSNPAKSFLGFFVSFPPLSE